MASLPGYALFAVEVLVASAGVWWLLRRSEPAFERLATVQSEFLRTFPDRYVPVAIFGAAGISLFLELAMVRWQASVFPFFAFYKNFSILACFAGLGLGYATARKKQVPLFLAAPLFCWQFLLMLGMRYGLDKNLFTSLYVLPFREQLNMGCGRTPTSIRGCRFISFWV